MQCTTVHQIIVLLHHTPVYYICASCEKDLDSGTSQHVCYHKCAKKLGLEKKLAGYYKTKYMVLILIVLLTPHIFVFLYHYDKAVILL